MACVPIPLPDADLAYDPQWLEAAAADRLLVELRDGVAWENHRVRLFGREHPSPRLSCWIGDPDTAYRYSGSLFEPRPWPALLLPLRDRLSHELGVAFNSVLANLYRDGHDCMGWHSDDERELGAAPVIASVSLGATRRFVLKHRQTPQKLAIELPHGSLMVMAGMTQRHYRHALPRTVKPVGERINLTFRKIHPL
ncbi:alpha-ketoglutarate-dependent dioxygenase AlkB family protein [Lysobacter solisilvae (ex Woo and Kim 2020)]|uniref:Alpha-ketoglutarate-dependent dioxygenase AlkB n=1 Tax=Agrilutibacter terrestris TaxID=2865112 RepID=A0A7H0FZE8_9GAMM|nr:alpha-ketoglutarate-dependent dioxygenase AlkB [Lysobacter terrestris]QNP41414.1 alpha-ketoglutarate-dependent dioxygenase AlkB [Lysobacter terrestris]